MREEIPEIEGEYRSETPHHSIKEQNWTMDPRSKASGRDIYVNIPRYSKEALDEIIRPSNYLYSDRPYHFTKEHIFDQRYEANHQSRGSEQVFRNRSSKVSEDSLSILSEAASLISQRDDGQNSSKSIDAVYAHAIEGYIEPLSQKYRRNSNKMCLEKIEAKIYVRDFLSAPSDSQHARLIAARLYFYTGYPLMLSTAVDCASLLKACNLIWLANDSNPYLRQLPILTPKRISSEQEKDDLIEKLRPMLNRSKKSSLIEKQVLQRETGLAPHPGPNGSIIYRDPNSSGYSSVPTQIYAERYYSYCQRYKEARREMYRKAADRARRSPSHTFSNENKRAKSDPIVLERTRAVKSRSGPPSFSSWLQIPTVDRVPLIKVKDQSKYPSCNVRAPFKKQPLEVEAKRELTIPSVRQIMSLNGGENIMAKQDARYGRMSQMVKYGKPSNTN
eukprot:CAMPEP_0171461740 /NCGR_PEP_ID=MMETSP0945-20130129/6063_1 /TAXON_ID=109269 /ORGANISM="Vaucheria litorea, Strain CCMP2940" /LENGTH=445 /DNA_ID=CAMNT_0011988139 /DNA_START=106 /DNA_END=1440 /DNA_ORIENTATION=+